MKKILTLLVLTTAVAIGYAQPFEGTIVYVMTTVITDLNAKRDIAEAKKVIDLPDNKENTSSFRQISMILSSSSDLKVTQSCERRQKR